MIELLVTYWRPVGIGVVIGCVSLFAFGAASLRRYHRERQHEWNLLAVSTRTRPRKDGA